MASSDKKDLASVFSGIKAKKKAVKIAPKKTPAKKKATPKKKVVSKKKVTKKPEKVEKEKEVEETEEDDEEIEDEEEEEEEEEVEEKVKPKKLKLPKRVPKEKKKPKKKKPPEKPPEVEEEVEEEEAEAEEEVKVKPEKKPAKKPKIKLPSKKKKKTEEEEEPTKKKKKAVKVPKKKRVKKTVSKKDIPLVKGLITSEEELHKVLGSDMIHFEDGEELEDLEGVVITIMGLKGDGKTTLALSVEKGMFDSEFAPNPDKCEHEDDEECDYCRPTIIFAVSMDGQTNRIAKQYRKQGKRVHVYNGLKYYSEKSDEVRLMTSSLSCHFINDVLIRQIPAKCKKLYGVDRPDYVMIDDMEELAKIAEGKMRDDEGLGIIEAFTNYKLWAKRNQIVDEIHRRAGEIAREAVIYTTYMRWEEAETDSVFGKRKMPKWVASIKKKTNIVIEAEAKTIAGTRTFQAQVLNAKDIGWTYNRKQCHTDFGGLGGLWNLRDPLDEDKFFESIRE